ncbi:MAG: ArsR family transcriptional regulator [Spirochaetales bacterium]|nr:MAG: ArsR family transcriptional regulator [Spirochaetales bacterium]
MQIREKPDLIFHPVRMRIIAAVSGQKMTAKDIAELLPDVPQTTLYRHLNILAESGIIEVAELNQIRGTVEKVYIMPQPPSLRPEDLRGMKKSDYERAFRIFLSSFIADMKRYLDTKPDTGDLNVLADGVEIDKGELYLSDGEFGAMNSNLQSLMLKAAKNKPASGRRRRVFSYLFLPVPDVRDGRDES